MTCTIQITLREYSPTEILPGVPLGARGRHSTTSWGSGRRRGGRGARQDGGGSEGVRRHQEAHPGRGNSQVIVFPRIYWIHIGRFLAVLIQHTIELYQTFRHNQRCMIRRNFPKHSVPPQWSRFLEPRVAPHKRLAGGVFFVDQLPRSAAGKLLRKELKSLRWSLRRQIWLLG